MTNEQSLALANPELARRVLPVLVGLRQRGWSPYVLTWRSAAQQAANYASGASKVSFSFHQAVDPQGRPAALAADVLDTRWPKLSHGERALFLRTLGALAKAQGLHWGGDWKPDSTHGETYDGERILYSQAPYLMGWDPVHVQLYPNSALDEVKAQTLAALRRASAAAAPAAAGGVVVLGLLALGGLAVAASRRA